jgi:hypothetical protein
LLLGEGEGEVRLREEGVGVLKWVLSLLRPRCLYLLYSSNSEGVSDTVIIAFRIPAVVLVGADKLPSRGNSNPVATIIEGVGVRFCPPPNNCWIVSGIVCCCEGGEEGAGAATGDF